MSFVTRRVTCCFCFENLTMSAVLHKSGTAATGNHAAVCPRCGHNLPHNIGRVAQPVVVLVGARSSGKSQFLAVLINHLREQVCRRLNAAIRQQSDDTEQRYQQLYHRPLYENHTLLAATPRSELPLPLIYRLQLPRWHWGRGWLTRSLNLVLFDTAGDDWRHENEIARYQRCLLHASGIIFLLDPSEFPGLRGRLPDAAKGEWENPDHILARIINLFECQCSVKNGQIQVPVAFVLSKLDTLHSLLQHSPLLSTENHHAGGVDCAGIERLSAEVKSYLQLWKGGNLINLAEHMLAQHAFFAVSSLGHPPQGQQVTNITPLRVEDPLLWLLYQWKYLRRI
jgi:GTPase SAR1 family protein